MINEKEKEGNAYARSMRLLKALKTKSVSKTSQTKRLMHVEAHVNNKPTKAMVDMGATHNFLSMDEAKRLELQASKEGRWIKVVNSSTKPLQGVVHEVMIYIDKYEGKINFIMALVDNFKVVLRMDFLWKVKVVLLPFLCTIDILDILEEETPCLVPSITEGMPKTPLLLAMEVNKGLKKKRVTYLATLREEKEDSVGEPMPKEIKVVHHEFKDVMSLELPKKLLPRREEDHKIKLEPRIKTPCHKVI